MNADSPLEIVRSHLEGVHERQPGQFSALCPAHADKGPSLSVRENPDGAVLLHCFAGCTVHEVVAALGLELHDLFPPRERPAGAPRRLASLLTAGQALALLDDELTFAAVALTNATHGVVLTPADLDRLRLAAGRVGLLRRQTVRGSHAA
jgi:hypothetical protein